MPTGFYDRDAAKQRASAYKFDEIGVAESFVVSIDATEKNAAARVSRACNHAQWGNARRFSMRRVAPDRLLVTRIA